MLNMERIINLIDLLYSIAHSTRHTMFTFQYHSAGRYSVTGLFTDVITIGKGVTELSYSSREGHLRAHSHLLARTRRHGRCSCKLRETVGSSGGGNAAFAVEGGGIFEEAAVDDTFTSGTCDIRNARKHHGKDSCQIKRNVP